MQDIEKRNPMDPLLILDRGFMSIDFFKLLREKKYIDNIEKIEDRIFHLDFVLRDEKTRISLKVYFTDSFPNELPIIALNRGKNDLKDIPHVYSESICYYDDESQSWSLDPSLAFDFIFENLDNVFNPSKFNYEFHREFEAYFNKVENVISADSFITPINEIKKVYAYINKKNNKYYFCDSDEKSKKVLERFLHKGELQFAYEALYISLERQYTDYVPSKDRFWSHEEIKDLITNHISSTEFDKLDGFKQNKNEHRYIIDLLLLTNQRVLFGLLYNKLEPCINKVIPIIEPEVAEQFKITPVNIHRLDKEHLLQRTNLNVCNNKVLIIGCGALGSDITFTLARSGIEQITIVDKDKLKMENSYRHFLGMFNASLGWNKPKLMQFELNYRYPHAEISIHNKDIYEVVNKDIQLSDYDLIISSTGNPATDRFLNKKVLETNTPAIFTWIEAYGIGGHALLMNNGQPGCLECLFDNYYNSYSFAAKQDKPFAVNVHGCFGSFTPYGSIDSMQTALIASRLAISVLQGKEKRNPLVSWKGDSTSFINNGFIVSDRYLADTTNNITCYDYLKSNCICSDKES